MNNTEQELKKIYESKIIRKVLKWSVIVLIALVIFQAGQFVGLKRAEFSFKMADNYYNNFDSRGRGVGMPNNRDFTESHGAAGKIIKISLPIITVSTPDNVEKAISITNDTVIRKFRDSINSTDLKNDDFVVAIGEPTDKGQIEAKFIRVMPRPMMGPIASSTNK